MVTAPKALSYEIESPSKIGLATSKKDVTRELRLTFCPLISTLVATFVTVESKFPKPNMV